MGLPHWEPNRAQRKTPLGGHCFVQSSSQTGKVIPGGVSQKKRHSGFSFKVFFCFVLFFNQKWPNKLKWWYLSETKSLSHLCPLLSGSQNGLCWSDQLFVSLKERKLCFCHWFSHMKSSHHPFLGLKLLCLKVPSRCASRQLVLETSWIVYVQIFLNFILFWNFASLGLGRTGHPIWLWKLWAGSVLIF